MKTKKKRLSVTGVVGRLHQEFKARAREASELGFPLAVSPINRSGYQAVTIQQEERRQTLKFNTPNYHDVTLPWDE